MQVQFVLTSTADKAFPSSGGEQGAGTRKKRGESVRDAQKGGRKRGYRGGRSRRTGKKLH